MTNEQKEKAAKIWGDVKDGLENGYNASKKGLKKAGAAIQKFSDMSVVSVEKKQFESKRKKVYLKLGELAAQKLSSKKPVPLTPSDEDVDALLKEISQFTKEIAKREKILKELEKKDGGTAESKTKSKSAEKTMVKKAPAKKSKTDEDAE